MIDDSYEPVEYERSPSGSLMWNRKRYMKWDADARQALADLADNKSISSNDTIEDEEFVIKFCINENEKYCQTEDLPVPDAEDYFNYYNKQNCYVDQLLQKSADGNRWRFTSASNYNSDDSCSYFSNNRVKKPQQSTNDMLLSSNSSSSSISTITSFNDYNENCVDPFEAWRHMDTCQLDFCTQNFAPSLWEHCTGCGSQASGVRGEEKSIPANRLLKDELREEAEELMMDLQSMQNLYVAGDLYEEQAVEDCVLMDETSDAKFYDQQFYGITKLMQEIISPQLLNKMFTPNAENTNDLQLDEFDEQTAFARIMKWPNGVLEEVSFCSCLIIRILSINSVFRSYQKPIGTWTNICNSLNCLTLDDLIWMITTITTTSEIL